MSESQCLVVYYSRTGNTGRVAEALAERLKADVEEVIDKKSRKGVLGFLGGGKDAKFKNMTDIEPTSRAPGDYQLVVIGTPVWASTMCPAIRTYIARHRGEMPRVAFFLTTGGSGIDKTFDHMEEACQKEPVARLGLKAKQIKKDDWRSQTDRFAAQLGEELGTDEEGV